MNGLILPEGMEVLPGTLNGLRGPTRGPQGGFRIPEKVQTPGGRWVTSWYCHHYRTPAEHYHTSHEELRKCPG